MHTEDITGDITLYNIHDKCIYPPALLRPVIALGPPIYLANR